MKEKISITIERNLLREVDNLVDHIYIKNRSHAIEYLVQKWVGGRRVAVVLCGGEPKDLLVGKEYRPTVKLGKQRLIEHTLKKLGESHFTSVFIIGRKPVLTAIFDIVKGGDEYNVEVKYIEEKTSKGTANSLRLLKKEVNTAFLVVYGDIVIDNLRLDELWESHVKNSFMASLVLTTSPTPSKKGIVRLEGSKVLSFTQKPKHADIYIGFSSMFVAEPELLSHSGEWLEHEVFPQLAERGLLGGHVSSEQELHIHTEKDLQKALRLLRA